MYKEIDPKWFNKTGIILGSAPKEIKLQNFLNKALLVHGDTYDYSAVDYTVATAKIDIICKVHGVFSQRATDHLAKGYGCPKCSSTHRYSTKEFIEECISRHGDSFDYSETEYTTSHGYIFVKCNICSSRIKTKAYVHLQKGGCMTCSGLRNKTTEEFILASKSKFGDKFQYANTKTKLSILCKEHGEILVLPDAHLASKYGCIYCSGGS